MGDKPHNPYLRLVDDPVARTIWMLRSLPLDRTAAYLELALERAEQLGLLSPADRKRIADLLRRLPLQDIDDRAA
jgi:hypothetical protein